MPLTRAQIKAYLADDNRCPYCHSSDIHARNVTFDGGTMGQKVACLDCGKRWWDEYKLIGITEVEDDIADDPIFKEPDKNAVFGVGSAHREIGDA